MQHDSPRAATLHLLAGPWASGKTLLVPHLRRLLPEVVVFDWDVLLPGLSAAAGKDAHTNAPAWSGLRALWTAVVASVLAGGRDVLLCGPAVPDDLAASGIPAARIRCAYLDCADETLAQRLGARGKRVAEIKDELDFMRSLRQSLHVRVKAGNRPPHRIAADVAEWVLSASRALGSTSADC